MGHTFVANEVSTAANLNSLLPPISAQSGSVRITPVANTPTPVQVTFPTPFPVAPVVVASGYTTAVGDLVKGVSVSDVSTTGFTVWVYRTNSTAFTVAWQAWGVNAGLFVDGLPAYQSLLDSIASSPMRVQVGSRNITPTAGAATSGGVTFPTPFASTPTVLICPQTAVPGTVLGATATGVSTSGFTAWVWRSNTTSTALVWIALGRL